jgi:Zn-dependent protease/predicted transcriptional regulator
MSSGVRLGRLFGIRLALDWTVLFIFLLVVVNLGVGVLPVWHHDWSPWLLWSVAAAAGLLLLISILLHELSHALVGRAFGMSVRSITLFVFGGVTDIEREPPSPRGEFFMAIVGPITSLVLGALFLVFAGWRAGGTLNSTDPAEVMQRLGPIATLLAWLGPVNVLLGLFNLVPGFPLDGGRVLRALLWWRLRDLHRATRWASRGGQLVGWLLITTGLFMAFGVEVPIFGRGLVGGLWLAFIGWFLNNAAVASYRQLLIRDLLEDIPVSRLMRTPVRAVTPDLSVFELVDDYVMSGDDPAFPVVQDEKLVGVVGLGDIRKVERQRWAATRVRDVMTPAARLFVATLDEDLFEALRELGAHDLAQLPVVDGGALRGVIRRKDIARWLSIQLQDRRAHDLGSPELPD